MNLGQEGEELVAKKYLELGYKVLDRNVRLHASRQYGEIDIIAVRQKEIVFVEVKTRRSETFGSPAEAVHPFKQIRLIRSAKLYLLRNPKFDGWDWRIDVAEVNIDNSKNPVIILENVVEDVT